MYPFKIFEIIWGLSFCFIIFKGKFARVVFDLKTIIKLGFED